MATIKVYNMAGAEVGTMEISDVLFGRVSILPMFHTLSSLLCFFFFLALHHFLTYNYLFIVSTRWKLQYVRNSCLVTAVYLVPR